jgi:hypothetical protein
MKERKMMPIPGRKAFLWKEFFGVPEVQPHQGSQCFVETRERESVLKTYVFPEYANVPVRSAVNDFASGTKSLMQVTHQSLPRAGGLDGSQDAKDDHHRPQDVVDHNVVLDGGIGNEANTLVELLRSISLQEHENELDSAGVNIRGFGRGPIKHLMKNLRAEVIPKLPAQLAPGEKVKHDLI